MAMIKAQGHELCSLAANPNITAVFTPSPASYASWLGDDWQSDAVAVKDWLANHPADWLIVDHYAIDRRWEQAVSPVVKKLLVIDDLADRPHQADVLLDQNLGRQHADYQRLVDSDTRLLIGPEFALLRPEFALWRGASLARRALPNWQSILVMMGGADLPNFSQKVLLELNKAKLPPEAKITVVLGQAAPWEANLRNVIPIMRVPTELRIGVNNMAEIMAEADVAIAAAGSAAWERCCVGLPTIQLVLAENQRKSAIALAEAGAVIALDEVMRIGEVVTELTAETLQSLSLHSQQICQGDGVAKVASLIIGDK